MAIRAYHAGLVVCACLIAVAACSGDGGGPTGGGSPVDPPPAPRVARTVQITAADVRFADTVLFTAAARDSLGALIPTAVVEWRSTAPSAASVTAAGVVVGVSTGEATIIARVDGAEDSVRVAVPPHYVRVDAGFGFACAITDEGRAYCWGSNEVGQLGDGGAAASPVPVPVATDVRFASIHAGEQFACGLTAAGAALCWGNASPARVPEPVPGSVAFSRLGLGRASSCGVGRDDGALYCWGVRMGFHYGDSPTLLDGSRRYVDVALSEFGACALAEDGHGYCWADNSAGQYGNDSYESSDLPVAAFTGHAPTRIAVGTSHTCVLPGTGVVHCAGQGGIYGSLGELTGLEFSSTPVRVAMVAPAAVLEAGNRGTCAVLTTGAVYCWGSFMRVSSAPWPLPMPTPITFRQLALGDGSGYGLTSRGRLYAWGANDYGQLGDGSTTRRESPVPVPDP